MFVSANNSINDFEPALTDPAGGDYSPVSGGNVDTATPVAIPDFPAWDTFANHPGAI